MPPMPLGIPLSSDFDELTATGGLGSGLLLGEPKPLSRSRDLTEDTVSERSRTGTEEGDLSDSANRADKVSASEKLSLTTGDGRGLVLRAGAVGGMEGGITVPRELVGRQEVWSAEVVDTVLPA